MSILTARSVINNRDFGCDRRTRRAATRPRTSAAVPSQATAATSPISKTNNAGQTAFTTPAVGAQILRRWSVAELIAGATWREQAA